MCTVSNGTRRRKEENTTSNDNKMQTKNRLSGVFLYLSADVGISKIRVEFSFFLSPCFVSSSFLPSCPLSPSVYVSHSPHLLSPPQGELTLCSTHPHTTPSMPPPRLKKKEIEKKEQPFYSPPPPAEQQTRNHVPRTSSSSGKPKYVFSLMEGDEAG